ncbi:hypothetical protein [Calothrix rhizosoleniae]|uniref:hypothetical protein n=1 Tax=Calothrix rhizosoleniae TaxID=888997 RepID=UPI000B49B065|nr:hypothetical protein [Calothrix rhizosoleniae]
MQIHNFDTQVFIENQIIEIPTVNQGTNSQVSHIITPYDYLNLVPAIIVALTPLLLALIKSRKE